MKTKDKKSIKQEAAQLRADNPVTNSPTVDQSSKPLIEQPMADNFFPTGNTQEPEIPWSQSSASVTDQPVVESFHESLTQTRCHMLSIPLEARLIIYKHVFDSDTVVTGPINKKTFVRIHTINQTHCQHNIALLRTCRTIYTEVKELVNPRSIIKDISAEALVKHMEGDCREDDYRLQDPLILHRIIKLMVRIGIQQGVLSEFFAVIDSHQDAALSLKFLDEVEPDGTSSSTDRGWPWLLQAFVPRSAKSKQQMIALDKTPGE
ncbi:hypothetical protein QM012_005541 [Aureobasidium pullulans]|uniref:Uncharacterized protein n=1 Tax=Aureobasidium pullulans TaxID=5580 RepID=A0ABR0T4Q5_AURPU